MKVRLSVMFLRMLNDVPTTTRPRYGRYRHVPLMKLGGLHLSWCITADWCLRSHLIVHCSLPQTLIASTILRGHLVLKNYLIFLVTICKEADDNNDTTVRARDERASQNGMHIQSSLLKHSTEEWNKRGPILHDSFSVGEKFGIKVNRSLPLYAKYASFS
jgi:hypothetical protein